MKDFVIFWKMTGSVNNMEFKQSANYIAVDMIGMYGEKRKLIFYKCCFRNNTYKIWDRKMLKA